MTNVSDPYGLIGSYVSSVSVIQDQLHFVASIIKYPKCHYCLKKHVDIQTSLFIIFSASTLCNILTSDPKYSQEICLWDNGSQPNFTGFDYVTDKCDKINSIVQVQHYHLQYVMRIKSRHQSCARVFNVTHLRFIVSDERNAQIVVDYCM